MLTIEKFRELNLGTIQSEDRVEISFEDLKIRVVDMIKKERLATSLETEDFNKIARDTITQYIYAAKPFVAGYLKGSEIQAGSLIADLYDSIVNWGKLTICKEDDSIREIQINGPSIFIDKSRGYELLRDPITNEPVRFSTPDEATDFIKSLLVFSGERLTEDEPLVNASTIEGFRLSCTSPVIFPPHPTEPTLKWVTATIRKVGGGIFERKDLIDRGTVCGPDLDLIALFYQSLIGVMVVGTTGCGKTTISDYGLRHIKDTDRVIAIQAPTEYNNRHMLNGVMHNNAVYWEVDSTAKETSIKTATQNNLVTHSLRNTATYLYLGELRSGDDFASAARANNAGTKVASTFHTFNVVGAVDRYALELVNSMHIEMEIGRELACRYMEIIVVCDRLGDGTRKVMGIAEVIGYDRVTHKYIINYLFEFILVDTIPRPDTPEIVDNVGYFVKRNNPSQQIMRDMIKSGVSQSDLKVITDIPNGTVLREVNFDKLPSDYVVKYDNDIIPMHNSLRNVEFREQNIGVGI